MSSMVRDVCDDRRICDFSGQTRQSANHLELLWRVLDRINEVLLVAVVRVLDAHAAGDDGLFESPSPPADEGLQDQQGAKGPRPG
ncbi:hypothetical protein [Aminobacter ciceronei]|jgi:hypothetical protein|uniref:hypothetical protein n=1 Tax=Aminobacter ciceronei TaxID=150723 RepID=UPI003F70A493